MKLTVENSRCSPVATDGPALRTYEDLTPNFVTYLAHIHDFTLPMCIGDCHFEIGEFDQALQWYQQACDYSYLNKLIEAPAVWLKMANAYLRFGLYLAERAREQIQDKPPYSSLEDVEWERYKQLAAKAVAAMQVYLTSPTKTRHEALYKHLSQVREAQDETERPMGKYTVRIIHSTHLLVIEHALECFTSPEPGYWTYQAARQYAERFDSRYGTGLNPASAPPLQDILRFWTG